MTRKPLGERSTGDIMVLMISGTICFGLVATGAIAAVFAFVHPDADLSGPSRFIADVVNTLIGLLAGFLAGRTDANLATRKAEPDESPDA